MIKAYKYRLNPTKAQATFFEKSFGCTRFVYNWALNLRIETYQRANKKLSWIDLCKRMALLKKEPDTSWLNEVSAQSLQCSIKNIDSA